MKKWYYATQGLLQKLSIYSDGKSSPILALSSYSVCLKFHHFLSKFIWALAIYDCILYICQTPIVVDIQIQSKHVYGVIGVDIVILQYVCCHDHDSNIFFRYDTFSVS